MRYFAFPSILLVVLLLACAAAATVYDFEGLIRDLQATGEAIEVTDLRDDEMFSEDRRARIDLAGAMLTALEYDDASEADIQASLISPDGYTIQGTNLWVFKTTSKVRWIDTPHFFKKGKVIVLYVGNDESVLQLLVDVLGPQFAGG